MEHLREQIMTCSGEYCGNSLVAEHCVELKEPGNNLVAEHCVELEEPGNNLVAERCSICES